MPNWVKCRVSMRGLEQEDVFYRNEQNRPSFDFNKIIPMPKESDMTSGTICDWCSEHWGTGQNACETEFVDTGTIEFKTAWSAPIPVLMELSKMFPERTVFLRYADENAGRNAESYEFDNGNVSYQSDNDESAALELYIDLWGEHSCIAKDENDKLYHKDCENCDGCS